MIVRTSMQSNPVSSTQATSAKFPSHKVTYLAPQASSKPTAPSSESSESSSSSPLGEGRDSYSSSGASPTSRWREEASATPFTKNEKNSLFTGDVSDDPNNEIEEDFNEVPSDAVASEEEGPVGEPFEGWINDEETPVASLMSTDNWGEGAGEEASALSDHQDEPMPTEALETHETGNTPNAFPPGKISSGPKGTGSPTGAIGPSTGAAASTGGTFIESGVASWYGPGFHGRTTANGEKYDQGGMTCAHKNLPFGTKVRVECNGKSVFVTVNDRGPFIKGRVIDLSKAAAQQLGIDKSGTASVKMYKV